MRHRLACSVLVLFIAAAPMLRAWCNFDCGTLALPSAASSEDHCAPQGTPAPVEPCSHEHSGILAAHAWGGTDVPAPALADPGDDWTSSFTTVSAPSPLATAGTPAESPPLSLQTPLRI